METAEYVEAVDQAGTLLVAAAEKAGLDAPVPSCPQWRVRDLLAHTGQAHRWATRFVAEGLREPAPFPSAPEVDDAALTRWFRDGHLALVTTLTAAPADLACWAFLPAPSPLLFWARRQAHETLVHRADAELAAGLPPSPVISRLAVDGVDELLTGFHARERSRVRTDAPRVLRLRATDEEAVWTVWLSDGVPRTERDDDGEADCELSGPAAQLYLALWNRLPYTTLTRTGDAALARLWRDRSGI